METRGWIGKLAGQAALTGLETGKTQGHKLQAAPYKAERALQALEHWAGMILVNVTLKESTFTRETRLWPHPCRSIPSVLFEVRRPTMAGTLNRVSGEKKLSSG